MENNHSHDECTACVGRDTENQKLLDRIDELETALGEAAAGLLVITTLQSSGEMRDVASRTLSPKK